MGPDEFDDFEESAEDVARVARELRTGQFRMGLEPLSLSLPMYEPTIPQQRVESYSVSNTAYHVDLVALSCTCPDFTKRRTQFLGRDVRRVCKHLLRVLDHEHALDHIDEIARAIVDSGCSKQHIYRGLVDSNHSVVVAVTPGDAWIDVFARMREPHDRGGALTGAYHRYGWNAFNHQWSYGDAPTGGREIRRLFNMSGLEQLAQPAQTAVYDERELPSRVPPSDALFDAAWIAVQAQGVASTSILQRELRVGYGRAARLIDQLHDAGLIGPLDGSDTRPLLAHAGDAGGHQPSTHRRTNSRASATSSPTRRASSFFAPLILILGVLFVLFRLLR